MLDKIKQAAAEGTTLLQFGFIKAVGQGLAPLVIAKFLASRELYARFSLAMMVVYFFASVLIAFAQTPFIVFANQERAKTGRINKSFSVQCIFLVFSFAAYVFLIAAFGKAVMIFAQISWTDMVFMSLALVGIAIKTFVDGVLLALGQRIKNSLAELVFGGLTLLLVFAFYLGGAFSLRMVFLVYLIAGLFVGLIFIWFIDFNLLLPICFDKQHFKEMFKFSKWFMLGATAAYFIARGDNFVLRYFRTMDDIGEYNLGYQVFMGLGMLIFIIYTYFLPFISEHIRDSAKMRSYLYSKRPRIFLMGLAVIGLLFVLAPYIFKLIGRVYEGSTTVLRVLLIAAVLMLYTIFYEPVFNALKKYKFTQTVNVLQVLLNLLLDVLLVPVMGMLGAAVATVIGYSVRTVIYEIYMRKRVAILFTREQ